MKHCLFTGLVLALLTVLTLPIPAEIVRPAPDFTWESFNGKTRTLSSIGKQPAILIIAPSLRSGVFKKQLHEIEGLFRQYASRGTLFFVAFTQEPGIVKTDIPILYVQDPATVATDYGLERGKFKIAVIGPDRNLDLASDNMTNAERLRDVIDNDYAQQSVRRAGQ